MRSRPIAFTLLALVLALAAGCGGKPSEVRDVESAVRRYNELLIVAFKEQDMNALAPVATEDQAFTEYFQMSALGEGGVWLDSRLREIAFDSVTVDGDIAVARTREVWDYDQVSLDTGEVVREEREVVYRLRYSLVTRDDAWVVDAIEEIDTPSDAEANP